MAAVSAQICIGLQPHNDLLTTAALQKRLETAVALVLEDVTREAAFCHCRVAVKHRYLGANRSGQWEVTT